MRARQHVDDVAAPSPGIGHNGPPDPIALPEPYALPPGKLADSICLPSETLDALSRAGKGPRCFKIGRRWYCTLSDFRAWLDDCASGKIDATLVEKRRSSAPPEPLAHTQPRSKPRPAQPRPQRPAVAERRPKRSEERSIST
jgi:hypothetical protein